MGKFIVTARNLSRIYSIGDRLLTGIDKIDLSICPGEFIALKGNSGSGKSTFLSLLAGLDQPTQGELTVDNVNLKNASASELTFYRRKVVGIVFQSFNLLPTLTVLENVMLPALLCKESENKVKSRAVELLGWLKLDNRLGHQPAQLSGGEMQRTAIARALINDPKIVLADEPTGNLDSTNGKIVIDLLAKVNQKQRRTLIVATHSNLADSFATRQIMLKDGCVTQDFYT